MKRRIATTVALLASVGLIVVGICLKQNIAVLQKAAKICLECVGIG